ncbi:MAG: hypothetical protein KAR22_06255, partial [Gammaproteobacteria bacterium]|nr:hypothetical protein [Gammaproteobacteria bacterium]
MKHRRFGRTGIDISELVFGGGFVGVNEDSADEATAEHQLRTVDPGAPESSMFHCSLPRSKARQLPAPRRV